MFELYNKLIEIIAFTQENYGDMSGAEKKQVAVNRLHIYVNTLELDQVDNIKYHDFIDDYIEDLIDILILVIRNKAIIKVFKKKCKTCF